MSEIRSKSQMKRLCVQDPLAAAEELAWHRSNRKAQGQVIIDLENKVQGLEAKLAVAVEALERIEKSAKKREFAAGPGAGSIRASWVSWECSKALEALSEGEVK